MAENEKTQENGNGDRRFELTCGIVLAFLAAILALSDLAGGRFEGDQMIAENEQVSAYNWYESKSIKQTLREGQRDLLEILIAAGSITIEQEQTFASMLDDLEFDIDRYEKENHE